MRDREREREREIGRDTGRGRSRLHAGSLMWDLIPGLQDQALGRTKAGAKPPSHPSYPKILLLLITWTIYSVLKPVHSL